MKKSLRSVRLVQKMVFEWEWGYVMLSELENLKLPFGLTIERDLYASGTVEALMGR